MEELTPQEIVLSGLGAGKSRFAQAAKMEIGASQFRKQMLARLHMLPKHIQRALKNNKAQISDAVYYSTGYVSGNRGEIIKTSVSEEVGKTNIDNGKLGKDRYFILSAIKLVYDTIETGDYNTTYTAAIVNGEWELQLNGRKVFENMPIRSIEDTSIGFNANMPYAQYNLNNPKVIEPQTPIEFNVNFPSSVTGYFKVHLIGTTVYAF